MRGGPEYGKGWRATYETEAGKATAEARHYARRRPPRAHEYARQMSRGRAPAMVEDPVHEWSLRIGNRPPATVRATPDGRFYTHAVQRPHDSLASLAEAYGALVARAMARPAPEDPALAAPAP